MQDEFSSLDVLRIITDATSDLKGRAALSHYPSRLIWTRVLHTALEQQLRTLEQIAADLKGTLKDEAQLNEKAKDKNNPLVHFRRILSVLIGNHLELLRKVLSVASPLPRYELDSTGIDKGFREFSDLMNAGRQYVESVLSDAFHLVTLDPAEFNYSVLNSLTSFLALAPVSLRLPFMTKELAKVLALFKNRQDKQTFARSKFRRFHEISRHVTKKIGPKFIPEIDRALEALFQFTSEFVHTGYFSTLITAKESGIFLGSQEGVFFPSTENYVEVQFILLKSVLMILGDIFFRALLAALEQLLTPSAFAPRREILTKSISSAQAAFERTGRQMHTWVANDALVARKEIKIRCICLNWFAWQPPHRPGDLYCSECGTVFRIIRMRHDFGYVILPQGPADVFGADSPRIDDLSETKRTTLYRIWEGAKASLLERQQKRFIPVLLVKEIDQFKMELPILRREELVTFIAGDALKNNEGIAIECNCTFLSIYLPKLGEDIEKMRCWACHSNIKLLALEGDSGYIFAWDKGKKRLADVQASSAKPVSRLTPAEKERMLREDDPTSAQVSSEPTPKS
jgi:hypothetical protein